MSRPKKKLRCICKGKGEYRVYPGTDRQRHIERCPMTNGNQRQSTL